MRFRYVSAKQRKNNTLGKYLSIGSLLKGPHPDVGLIYCVFGLMLFGWIMVYSSSALYAESRFGDQFFFLKRHLLWSLCGVLIFIIASNAPFSLWQSSTKWLYIGSVIGLFLVLMMGREISGAKRWLHISGFSFQPSEFAKVAMVFLVSDYLDRRQSRLGNFKRGLLPLLLLVGLPVGLIVVEPDLGTPVLMGGVLMSMLLIGGVRWRHFFLMGMASLPLLVFAIVGVRYRLDRLFAYLDPWSDAKGKGYQLTQSLTALGSGGIIGRGLGESKIKIGNLPDCHTDFVFSVLGEELGLFGTLTCAGLFLFLCLKGLEISYLNQNYFCRLVGSGISLTIGFQALINMGVAAGLFPTKGMPLPFISFGGSSLVMAMFSVGLLSSLSRQGKPVSKNTAN